MFGGFFELDVSLPVALAQSVCCSTTLSNVTIQVDQRKCHRGRVYLSLGRRSAYLVG